MLLKESLRMMSAEPEAAPAEDTRLKSLPEDSLPREKLLKLGRAALSDEELLAIFLRTGIPGCNVLELAARMKRAAGSLAALGSMDVDALVALHKGVGRAKAATLSAVFELGQRAARESIERLCLKTAKDVYNLLVGELRFEQQETLVLLLLDARGLLIRKERVATGTLTRLMVHPRNVFAPVMRHNAARFILVHNHPSGNSTPSKPDDELTRTMKQSADILCLNFQDHVIIGAPTIERSKPYFSYAEEVWSKN